MQTPLFSLSPPLWLRRLSRLFFFVTLCLFPFAQDAWSQCAPGISHYTVCVSGVSTVPEGETRTVTLYVAIQLGGTAPATFSISVSSSNGTASPSPQTVTMSSGSTSSGTANFVLTANDDSLYTNTWSFTASASRTDPGGVGGVQSLRIPIPDDESPPSFSLSASPTSWSEGDSSVSVSFTATLGEAIGKSLSVTFSASGTSDYTVSRSQTRTIPTGSTTASASLTFTPVDDNVDEPDIPITARASSSDSGIGAATVTLTQRDNDTSEALSFTRTSVSVPEGGTATYSVSLATRPTGTVTVGVSRSSGDSDLTVMPASLTFTTTNWNQGQEVTVSAAQDQDVADGSATIRHSASGGGYGSISGNVTATEDDDDTAALSFTRTSLSVPEGASATYKVSLAYEPSAQVTVAVSRHSGDSDLSVMPASLTFTTSNWNQGQEVTVSAAEDNDGLNGEATIRHTASGGDYASVTGDVTATESDNDRAILVTKASVPVTEGGTATYKVSLATRPAGTVTVAVSRSSGDSDLSAMPPSLTFTTMNWSQGQDVTVSAAEDDDLADGSATIRHSASGGGYGGVTRNVTATEDDNDTAALSFTRTSVTVPEGGNAAYSVSLAYEPRAQVRVAVSRHSGDSDLTVMPASLTFTTSNWNRGQVVTVSAAEDDDGADGEATIRHAASGGGYASVTADVTATEDDNDPIELSFSKTSFSVPENGNAKYSVSLATKPSAQVTVSVSRHSGDSDLSVNKSSLTFTTSNWNAGQEVTVSAAEDLDGLNGQATIRHTASGGDYGSVTGDVTATESDNDSAGLTLSELSLSVPEGRTASYSVALATAPSATVTVAVSRSSGDTDLSVNKSSLTFTTVNWFVTQSVTVSAAEDDDILDGEATISHTASGGGYGSVAEDATATERDNDSAGLSFTRTSLTVAEGGMATYKVRLGHRPGDDVRVALSRASGDEDLSVTPPSLTFTTSNWNRGQEVTVMAAEDDDIGDGRATIRHTASGGGYARITGEVTATEDDNDSPALLFTPDSLTVAEGGMAGYKVSLAYQPLSRVAVVITRASGDPDLSVMPASLSFSTSNWSRGQEVTVMAAEDDDLADGRATIRHAALGGGYDSVAADVTATEDDNDAGGLVFSSRSVTVPEGGSRVYTIRLAHKPSGQVTVAISKSSGDPDLSVMPARLTFTTSNWSQGQDVTVSAAEDDDLVDGSATIGHSASGGGYGSVTGEVTAAEDDNDAASLSFTKTSLTVAEGGMATYSVSLRFEPTDTVTVNLAAAGDPDLSVMPDSLTFTTMNWSEGQEVTVSAAEDDDLAHGRAAIGHTATGGGYAGVTESVTATEEDNDTPSLSFTETSLTVPEGGRATYKVSLAFEPLSAVAVAVGRASGDEDLSASPTTLLFTPNDWNEGRTVTVSADEDEDLADGTATIGHTALGGGYGSVTGEVMATEDDNDSGGLSFSRTSFFVPENLSATYTVRLAYRPSGTVTVAVSRSSGDSDLTVMPASLTFTTTNWSQGQVVTVSAAEDNDTTNGTATIGHSASGGGYGSVTAEVRVTESDNDAPGLTLSDTSPSVREGHTVTYTVSLAAEPSDSVTVRLTVTGDSDLSVRPASLTFTTANWSRGQVVTVSAAEDDDLVDGTATLTHTASGGGYDSVEVEATATEIDNDTASLVIADAPVTVEEGDTASYSVRLATKPSATVTVRLSRSSGDTDLSVDPASLTFTATNWNEPQDVTVSAREDEDGANGEATFLHTATGGDYGGVTAEVRATELDNDAPALVLSETSLEVDEDEGQASYTVKLMTVPSGPVTVAIASRDPDAATVSPPSLAFTTADWNEPQDVTVTGVDDFVDSDRTTRITHAASGADYGRVTATLEVTLRDDDTAGVRPDPEELQLDESGEGFYTLELASEPRSPVVISITRLGENVDNLDWNPKRLIFSAADWNRPQRVTLTAGQDEDALSGVALMRHTASSPDRTYNGIGIDDVEIIVGDDDQVVTSAVLTLSDEDIAEGEASALVTVTATLDAVTTADLSIVLSLGGTASAQDYDVGGELTITIDAGEQTGQTVLTFVPVDDALVEGDETIIVNGVSPGLTIPQVTLTLIDDDAAVGDAVGALSVDIDRVAESARDTLITVTLTLEEGFTFDELRTFQVSVRSTGAAEAVDFAPVSPLRLTLLSNVSTAQSTFVLRPENDLVDEIDETLTLSVIESPLPVTPAEITLVDDDAPPTGISLSVDDPDIAEGEPSAEITLTARVEGGTTYARPTTLTLAFGGTAAEGRDGDYTVSGGRVVTIPAGQVLATTVLTFTPVDDSRDELDETIEITGTTPTGLPVSPTSVTLLDNDESLLTLQAEPRRLQEDAGPAAVALTVAVRSGAPYDEDLAISLEFGGTAVRTVDYTLAGPFTFTLRAGNMSASTSLTVTPIDDALDEPDETLEITGNAGVGYTSTAVVLIIDNDIPPARIQLAATPATLAETAPATRVLLEARVEGSTAVSTDTEIALALEGTAVSTVDYDLGGINDPLILPAGRLSVARELNLTPIDDPHPEGSEQIVITGTAIVRVLPATITLLDDDGADLTVSFTQVEYAANEYGPPATVVVTVTPAADRREVIDLAYSHLGGVAADDYSGIPEEIVFEPGDEAFSFSVEALPDQTYESGERIGLRLGSLSPQVSFQPFAEATVLLVEQRSTEEFSGETRTVLALSSRAWSDSVQSALEERFARTRQTEQWGRWQPDYQEPPDSHSGRRSAASLPRSGGHADRLIPGDWLAAWRQKNERRNMGLVEPRLSLRKVLARLKGWRPVLWAEGSTHHFSGHARSLDYHGGFQAAHVGLDLHSGKRTLIGTSVMRGRSTMDYSNGQGLDGSTTATLYTIHPYLHFEAHERVTVWTIGGVGFAPLRLQELDRDHDLPGAARMAAGGVRIRAGNWGSRELAIRSDADVAWIGAKLPAESVTLGGHAARLRFLAELTQPFRVFGQDLIAAGEAGGRLDRGGGHRGLGAEAGGRVSWRKPERGLDFSAHGTSLLWHQSPFRIWGAGIQASWDPGAEKRGLVLRFASGRGPRGGRTRLFQQPVDRLFAPGDALDSELELGYGTGVGARLLTLTFRLRGLSGWTAAVDLR